MKLHENLFLKPKEAGEKVGLLLPGQEETQVTTNSIC